LVQCAATVARRDANTAADCDGSFYRNRPLSILSSTKMGPARPRGGRRRGVRRDPRRRARQVAAQQMGFASLNPSYALMQTFVSTTTLIE
jgi:hypothetical protein